MLELALIVFLTIISILAIGKGSDWFTESLVPVAKRLSVSQISVALILVSAAVSLPEILVAIQGAIQNHPIIGLGVVFGSIICNIGLMIGISTFIRPLRISLKTILRDGIFSIIIPIVVLAVSMDGKILRMEGLAILLLFIPYVINIYLQEKRISAIGKEEDLRDLEVELRLIGFNFGKLKAGWTSFFLGLLLLLGGTKLFTDQLITIVQKFGVSDLVVGLTIGAIGSSIPNIASAYKATKKGLEEMAVSETLGSNIFTLLVTLGILAMLSPISISGRWLIYDIPAVILMSLLLFIFMLTKRVISIAEGLILFFGYLAILAGQLLFFR
jgi:cation:H+ antiporter